MTYARAPGSFHAAVTRAVRALGREVLGRAAGVSPSRLDQMMNPMRRDLAVLERCAAIDSAAARAGRGTPILDAYLSRLAAGLPETLFGPGRRTLETPLPGERRRRLAVEGAARAALPALRRVLDGLESALAPPVPAARGAA